MQEHCVALEMWLCRKRSLESQMSACRKILIVDCLLHEQVRGCLGRLRIAGGELCWMLRTRQLRAVQWRRGWSIPVRSAISRKTWKRVIPSSTAKYTALLKLDSYRKTSGWQKRGRKGPKKRSKIRQRSPNPHRVALSLSGFCLWLNTVW